MSQKSHVLMLMWSKSCGRVPALCSLSDPRFAAQLAVTAACSRALSSPSISRRSSHISSASSFYFLAEDTRHRHRLSWLHLIGPRSAPSSAHFISCTMRGSTDFSRDGFEMLERTLLLMVTETIRRTIRAQACLSRDGRLIMIAPLLSDS